MTFTVEADDNHNIRDMDRIMTGLRGYACMDNSSFQMPKESLASEKITKILFGSKKNRFGTAPTLDETTFMFERVDNYVAQNRPIEMQLLWGVLKGYGLDQQRETADMLDLLGLKRFACLNEQVKQVYSPGLDVSVILEDITEGIIAGDYLDVDNLIGPYADSLKSLTSVMGISPGVNIVMESELMERKGIPQEFLEQKAGGIAQLIQQYWHASQNISPEKWESLPEYKILEEAGWKGTIPPEMREHYLCRAQTERPDSEEDVRIWSICKYFGNSLARYSVGLFTNEDPEGPQPVRASLAPHATGASKSLRLGRVEYKLMDDKKSNTSVPPWAGYSYMRETKKGFKPTAYGLRDVRKLTNSDFQRFEVVIESDKGYTPLRVDVLSSN